MTNLDGRRRDCLGQADAVEWTNWVPCTHRKAGHGGRPVQEAPAVGTTVCLALLTSRSGSPFATRGQALRFLPASESLPDAGNRVADDRLLTLTVGWLGWRSRQSAEFGNSPHPFGTHSLGTISPIERCAASLPRSRPGSCGSVEGGRDAACCARARRTPRPTFGI